MGAGRGLLSSPHKPSFRDRAAPPSGKDERRPQALLPKMTSWRDLARFYRAVGLLIVLAAMPALAHDYQAGSIIIVNPWSRATPGGAKIGVGYLKITNTGPEPDRLIAGSVDIAEFFELHTSTVADGVASMRLIEGGLEIRAGESVELKPGGNHVMLVNLKSPLRAGRRFSGTLTFEKAGPIKVEFVVQQAGSSGGRDSEHGHHHGSAGKPE